MASSMASLPRIQGHHDGRKAEALAVRSLEAGWFTEGSTKLLIRYLDKLGRMVWVDKDSFYADHESTEK